MRVADGDRMAVPTGSQAAHEHPDDGGGEPQGWSEIMAGGIPRMAPIIGREVRAGLGRCSGVPTYLVYGDTAGRSFRGSRGRLGWGVGGRSSGTAITKTGLARP